MTLDCGTKEKLTMLPRRRAKKRASEYVKQLRATKQQLRAAEQKAEKAKLKEKKRVAKEIRLRSIRELPRADLLAFALQGKDDEWHQVARRLVVEDQGKPWKAIRRAAQEEKRTKSLIGAFGKKATAAGPLPAAASPAEIGAFGKKATAAGKIKLVPNKRKPFHGNKKSSLPSVPANLGNDYLKPMSKEYDMPEYDLE